MASHELAYGREWWTCQACYGNLTNHIVTSSKWQQLERQCRGMATQGKTGLNKVAAHQAYIQKNGSESGLAKTA
eukprot:12909944-Prorocentrum_lima.AAC.1